MKVNPVYGKEMKLRVRSVKFAMTILFFNLVLIAIALFGFEVFFNVNINTRIDYSGAITVYFILICLEAVMVALLVPVFTAGSIAGEREKQTLEILLTTVLKPMQIVIGKLMSSISMILLLVFSSLPVISIVFTIGGINMINVLQFVLIIIVVFVANASANMYYYNMQSNTAPYPDVTWAAYFLLINPAFTMLEMVISQYSSENLVSALSSGLNGHIPSLFVDHWFECSIVVQLVLTCLFLFLATRFLDPLRRKEKARKTKKKRRKKKEESGGVDG